MRTLNRTLAACGFSLAVLGALMCSAGATTVRPLAVELQPSGRGMNQTIFVENTSADPLPVELTVQELAIDASGAHGTGKDPGDLVVFPPQALIAPGQTQSFRIQYVGDPALAKPRHYYITVAQLPVQLPKGQSGVQILSNFEVLANVGPLGAKPELHVVSAEIGKDKSGLPVPVITVANNSATYGYLSHANMRIVETDERGNEVFSRTFAGAELGQMIGMGLVDSGESRQFMLPLKLPSASGSLTADVSLKN